MVVLPDTFLDELPAPHREAGVFRAASLDAGSVAAALADAAQSRAAAETLWTQRRAAQGLFCMAQHANRLSSCYARMACVTDNR